MSDSPTKDLNMVDDELFFGDNLIPGKAKQKSKQCAN